MSATSSSQPSAFASLDDAKINRFQLKIMFVSGMGFFTDAYDLFVIGIPISILKDQWHLDTNQVSLLASTTLAASAVGAIPVRPRRRHLRAQADVWLRVLILSRRGRLGVRPDVGWLIVFRIVLGIGIGGDYPVARRS